MQTQSFARCCLFVSHVDILMQSSTAAVGKTSSSEEKEVKGRPRALITTGPTTGLYT